MPYRPQTDETRMTTRVSTLAHDPVFLDRAVGVVVWLAFVAVLIAA